MIGAPSLSHETPYPRHEGGRGVVLRTRASASGHPQEALPAAVEQRRGGRGSPAWWSARWAWKPCAHPSLDPATQLRTAAVERRERAWSTGHPMLCPRTPVCVLVVLL